MMGWLVFLLLCAGVGFLVYRSIDILFYFRRTFFKQWIEETALEITTRGTTLVQTHHQLLEQLWTIEQEGKKRQEGLKDEHAKKLAAEVTRQQMNHLVTDYLETWRQRLDQATDSRGPIPTFDEFTKYVAARMGKAA